MLEPTVVVAIAAASARPGAGIETKLAEAMLAAAAKSAVNKKLTPPASPLARGSSGAPAMTFRASRRVVSMARVMALESSRNWNVYCEIVARRCRETHGTTGNPTRTVGVAHDSGVAIE